MATSLRPVADKRQAVTALMIFCVLFLYLPLIASLGAFVWLIAVRSRPALAVTIGSSTLTLAMACAISWFFRDGMGPDSIPSEGMEAARRFFSDAIIAIAVWLAFVFVSVSIYCSKKRPTTA